MKKFTRRLFATLGMYFEDYFPQGWRFFQLEWQELIVGFWIKQARPPFWFAQWFFSLFLLPLAILAGIALGSLSFWWVIAGLVLCHFAYSAIMMVQEWTYTNFWMFVQDVTGRFLWLVFMVAFITLAANGLWALIF